MGYGLLFVFLVILGRWIIGVIFSRPKETKISTRPVKEEQEIKTEKVGPTEEEGWLQVVVFEDRDGNRSRGLGERGLDWEVYYRVGENKEQVLKTKVAQRCFPTIFNWMYGGCSQEVKVPVGKWVKVYLKRRPGWRFTKGEVLVRVKRGKNLVYLGVRRLKPGEKEELEEGSKLGCKRLVVIGKEIKGETLKLKLKVEPYSQRQGLKYRVIVNQMDLGLTDTSQREVSLKKGKEYIIKAFVEDGVGHRFEGEKGCVLKVNGKIESQPETGSSTIGLVLGLVVFPVVGLGLIKWGSLNL